MTEFEPVEPDLTLETEQEITSGSSGIGGRAVAGIVGVLLLVGGAVFAVNQAGSSGPESPEAAVQALFDAAADEDVLGVLASLDPAERDALRGPVEDLFDELGRLEVVDGSFELSGIDGVDLEFADVTYRTEPVRDGLARVYITGGTVTGTYDLDTLPIGDFVRDTLDRFEVEYEGKTDSDTTDLAADDTFLAVRESDDGWRVSIGYTAAEAARLDAGLPLPAGGITPTGADSPEAAVEGMVGAITGLDLEGMIARLSPAEFGALQEYAELFLADAQAELDTVRQDFTMSVDDLELRSETDGDRGTVFVDGFALTMTVDEETISFSVDGECFELSGDLEAAELEDSPFADGPVCADDLQAFSEEMFGGTMFGTDGSSDESENPFEGFEGFPPFNETPEVGIAVQRVDGEWFVAPLETVLDATVAGLQAVDRSHLDAAVDLVEGIINTFTYGFGEEFTIDEGFEETFEEIGEPVSPTTTFIPADDGSIGEPTQPTQPTEQRQPPGPVDYEAIVDAVTQMGGGDQAFVECMLSEVELMPPYVQWELGDSFVNGYDPSPETQDHFFMAYESCY